MQTQTQTQFSRPSKCRYDTSRKMLALQFNGTKDIRVGEVPVPTVTDPTDVIVRITATTICGSDLNLYHNKIPGLEKGDILGHEGVGIVDEVGPEVRNFKKGDRVVISSVIACGRCDYCKRNEWSCCDTTNPNVTQEEAYGHHTGALFGSSRSFGGYDGCQAEYVRVPFADVNLFPIPPNINDKQALCVSDIACTGYHGAILADVRSGDTVVVFGCGPVGLMTQMWSKHRGARLVIGIDCDPQRLEFARKHFGSETVNCTDQDPIEAVRKLIPGGPDKVIDCVGFRFPESLSHKVQQQLKIETDSPNIVNTAIRMVRKNGRITLIGDYTEKTNQFNIGGLMEKHLTINGGQLWPHSYQKLVFDAISTGKIDPSVVFNQTFPLSRGDEAYKCFDQHANGLIKPFLQPESSFGKGRNF